MDCVQKWISDDLTRKDGLVLIICVSASQKHNFPRCGVAVRVLRVVHDVHDGCALVPMQIQSDLF